jgi:uroporphyrinogen decarboxylase
LAQYRELRERYDILTLTRTPELGSQVTLMPVNELGVDAAVLYADIMLPLYGMGVPFSIDPGIGPLVHRPVRSAADVAELRVVDPHEGTPDLFETIAIVRRELDGKNAVIGFAGAPFTVASYLIEGKPTKDHGLVKAFMYDQPQVWHQLMEKMVTITSSYLRAQVAAGVQAVQLFDSWVGALSRDAYREYVLPYSTRIFENIADLDVPRIHFGTGNSHLLDLMATVPCEAVSVDWRLPLDEAWDRIGHDKGIQGNLDPAIAAASFEVVKGEAQLVLDRAANRDGHVFNLGHGVLEQTPSDNLKQLVEYVHQATQR